MMSMKTEMFHVSIIAPNAAVIVYGILFGGMHPITIIDLSDLDTFISNHKTTNNKACPAKNK